MLHLSMQRVSMAQVLSVDVRILGTLQGAACWCRLLVESRLVAALPYLRPLPIRVHRVWRVRSCERMAVVAHGILRRAPFFVPRIAISMIALCRVGHATYTAATTIAIIDIAIVMRRDHRRSSRFEPVGVRLRSMRHKQPHTLIQSMRVWKIMSMQTSSNLIS